MYAVIAMMTAAKINMRPSNFPSGLLSAIEPPNQLPMHKLVMMIPIRAVQTMRDVPKNGATNREPVSSRIIVAAPLKNDVICRRA